MAIEVHEYNVQKNQNLCISLVFKNAENFDENDVLKNNSNF
jgi:hypothetical protein